MPVAFVVFQPGREPCEAELAAHCSERLSGYKVPQRFIAIPELPTIAESGIPGFDVSSWFALFVPAKTSPEIVRTIHSGTISALSQMPVRGKFSEFGAVLIGSTPQELALHLDSEMRKWGPLIKEADIKADS